MQKLLLLILMLAMSFTVTPTTTSDPVEVVAVDPAWVEVTEETILTVNLPSNPSTGYAWSLLISDPDVLELVTEDYTPDEKPAEMTGSGGTWTASFRGLKAGTATLTLTYAASYDEASMADQRELLVNVDDDLNLTTYILRGPGALYALSEDQTAVTVRLPANATSGGYAWRFASEPEIMELVTEEYLPDEEVEVEMIVGLDATWVANFRAVPGLSGDTELTLSYQRDWETDPIDTCTFAISVREDGVLEINKVTIDKH